MTVFLSHVVAAKPVTTFAQHAVKNRPPAEDSMCGFVFFQAALQRQQKATKKPTQRPARSSCNRIKKR